MPDFTEADFENAILELFQNTVGYNYCYGPDIERDYRDPFCGDILKTSLFSINSQLPEEAVLEGMRKLKDLGGGSLLQQNMIFTDYLQNGIPVSWHEDGENHSSLVQLIDYNNCEANNFTIINQWTILEHSEKRPDVILFVNGIPLVVVELKSPSREETDASAAFRQLRNYMAEIPSLFAYNAICVMSDMATSKAGTITSGEDRFMEWKTKDGDYSNTQYATFDTFFEGLFQKDRFLDILKNFICFNEDGPSTFKILAAYHQYFAVKKALSSTQKALGKGGKAGVFWHTQGSGKSLSMVFYAQSLQKILESPTIVVLTDRNDLDDQLYGQFSRCKSFLRQTPQQATSRKHLKELLSGRQANGIIFTTMQKFEEGDDPLSMRENIVVMADEAHRGHYGLVPKIHTHRKADGELAVKTTIGTARIIRDNLPHATFIGFTGTPISSIDRNTYEVFGDCIDSYDMTQAVEDGATRPVYYESRVIRLNLDEDILKAIDEEYEKLSDDAEPYAIEKSKKELGRMDAILGADQTLDSLVTDILDHYENFREHELTGKAMIVAYSRPIAMKIYQKILALRPSWTQKIAVVMTQGNNDPEEWRNIIGNNAHKEALANEFKDNDSQLKIAIVVDMWLTGFDVPSLATMYVYKPMAGHNLMQAIARVNRVFRNKEGGLVVDYVGIASALKKAMRDYSSRDQENYGDPDIGATALVKFQEKLEICRDLLHGFDYSDFFEGSDLVRGKTISGAVNFLLGKDLGKQAAQTPSESSKDIFLKEAMLLRQAKTLCASLLDEKIGIEAAFMEAVRTILGRLASGGSEKKFSLKEINARINELLKQSIKSSGVLNLFSDKEKEFSLFDPAFIEEISKMQEKNIAVELLKKIISEQVSVYKRTNVVKSEKFSEIIRQLMHKYFNGLLTNEQVIEEMMNLAKEIVSAHKEGVDLGLSSEELAFYDALTKPQAVKDFYSHEELIALTKELTESLRKNRTIDWEKKKSARAGMRVMIKRLLRKHKYPPEGMEDAITTVLTQCELWVDNVA